MAQEANLRAEVGFIFSKIGALMARQDQPELAIVFYKQSVEVREAIRGDIRGLDTNLQQSFTDTVANDYRLLADLLLQQNRIIEAQRVLDLLKIQELDEAFLDVQRSHQTETGVEFWQPETDLLALYQQVIAETTELAQLQTQAREGALDPAQEQRLSELVEQYATQQARFSDFLERPEVATLLAQISQTTDRQNLDIETHHRSLQNNLRTLPQKTALLYPLILPDRLELIVVTADAPPLRYPIAVNSTDLNRAIVTFGQALKSPRSDIQPLAQQLYGWLIAPMAQQLEQAGIESIIYAPDGALRYIPLAALHDGEHYLTQRFSISQITAASLTNFDTPPQRDQRRLLAAACAECSFTIPVGDRSFAFSDLPYTETEVNTLAEQVADTSVLLNQGFTLSALRDRLGSHSIIHLATHGAFVVGAPNQSFLVMGSGETVSLETISTRWNLSHAELVVLSACDTAVGNAELGSGVEILGLGYQIQKAGAQAVMASLWQVSDRGTQILMTAFYEALYQGMTKTEALQAAQQAMITGEFRAGSGERGTLGYVDPDTGEPIQVADSLRHPYYWAPFILIGNGL